MQKYRPLSCKTHFPTFEISCTTFASCHGRCVLNLWGCCCHWVPMLVDVGVRGLMPAVLPCFISRCNKHRGMISSARPRTYDCISRRGGLQGLRMWQPAHITTCERHKIGAGDTACQAHSFHDRDAEYIGQRLRSCVACGTRSLHGSRVLCSALQAQGSTRKPRVLRCKPGYPAVLESA